MRTTTRWLIAGSVLTAVTATAASCGGTSHPGNSTAPPPVMPAICTKSGPLVFAVSGREMSPAPELTGMMLAAATKAVTTGAAIGLVDVDGDPKLVAASAFSDPSAGNEGALASDRTTYLGEFTAAVVGIRAKSPGVNVLSALDVAGHAIRAACHHGGTIYLEDSGLQEARPLDFRKPGALAARPAEVVAFLRSEYELPDLKGIRVVLDGIGDTASPQRPLSISQQANLVAIWVAIAKASGAVSVRVDPAPRDGVAPTHVPPVALVPVPVVATWSPSDKTFVFPDSGPVGFEPNTAVFRDPAAAAKALRRLANYLAANPSARIKLTGTTARWGTLSSDIALSLRRAKAVKAVLIELGVASSQIRVQGLGWKFRGYENDQGPHGTLLPGPAEHNRSVIVSQLRDR